jgi:hypothetical protein
VRRSISTIMLALATGTLSLLGPVANAATSTTSATSATAVGSSILPAPKGSFGVRLVDVPVSEADNLRALRYIVDYLPTGTVIHRRILIQNEEKRTVHFTVYADAARITGGLLIGYAGATHNELTAWISVKHPVVTLAAGASVLDAITIKVPRGATRGEHYGVIWVQQSAKVRKVNGFGVTEVARVGVRLYVAVGRGGVPPTSFDITSITGQRPANGRPVITAHVNNTGGRAIDLSGSARLTDGPGNTTSGPFSAQRIVTLAPGQSWNMTFSPPRSLPDGSWRVTITLVSGLTTATATATIKLPPIVAAQAGVSAMGWIWLGLGGLVLILVVVMGSYALQHRRRQAPA